MKVRPALIVQADSIDSDLTQVILVMISSNLRRVGRKSRYLVKIDSKMGESSGLLVDSVVMSNNIATILRPNIIRILGNLGPMADIDKALRHSLDL